MSRRLKNWIKTYLDYTEVSEAPERFHFWTAVSTVAGALRRKVWIDMGDFEWSPNLFVFFVAPAGVIHKSTTADIGVKFLREVEGVFLGPSSVTWQALIESFQEAQIDWKPSGIMEEGLPMACLTVVASELGTFFDPDNRDFIDLLVDIYDGRKGTFERRTRQDGKSLVSNPWLNLVACTTPAWISQYISQHFTGGGFASRTIFVYGDTKKRLIAYPYLEIKERRHVRANLISDLQEIAKLYGTFKLTKDATEWGIEWYRRHEQSPPKALANDTFSSYLARKQAHVHKVAMSLAAAQRDDMTITLEDLKSAEGALSDLEPDMPRAFRMMQREEIAGLAGSLLIALQTGGKMTQRELYLRFWREIGYGTFDQALTSLINTGLVGSVAAANGSVYLEVDDKLAAETAKGVLGRVESAPGDTAAGGHDAVKGTNGSGTAGA